MPQKSLVNNFSAPYTESQQVFLSQHHAYLQESFPEYSKRIETLQKLETLIHENTEKIVDAICSDFGHRSPMETTFLEIFPVLSGIRFTIRHLKKWMRPEKREVPLIFLTGKNRVIPQPKGIVGIVVPWNYPLFLMMSPLTSALAAGNRCIIKMAANSRNLCQLMHNLFRKAFPQELLAILPGAPGSEFSALPFNHLVFTGSAETGKAVMRSAADNLCPITLELGGKSPTIIYKDFDLKEAASRILYGKFVNAGQTCLAPDYLFIAEEKAGIFAEIAKLIVNGMYPDINTHSYTSIIDNRSYHRLRETLDDAVSKGARAIKLVSGDFNDALRKFPPHILLNVDGNMRIMKEEVFGPLLPVKTYQDFDEVIRYIKGKDRPLALYLFSNDKSIQEKVIYNTLSGGVTLNHVLFHVAQHDLPFGGIGASGIGHYHGYEGFMEMSKMRPVFSYPRISKPDLFYPPYKKIHERIFLLLNKFKLLRMDFETAKCQKGCHLRKITFQNY